MKAPIRQETNFLALSRASIGDVNIFEGRILLREILHSTIATFETTSSSIVAEPFIDFWTPNTLVFMIAWYNILQFDRYQCSHTNLTSSFEGSSLNKAPPRVRGSFFCSKQGAFPDRNYFLTAP